MLHQVSEVPGMEGVSVVQILSVRWPGMPLPARGRGLRCTLPRTGTAPAIPRWRSSERWEDALARDLVADAPDDVIEDVQTAGLIYVTDLDPGIRRTKAGHGFDYLDPS